MSINTYSYSSIHSYKSIEGEYEGKNRASCTVMKVIFVLSFAALGAGGVGGTIFAFTKVAIPAISSSCVIFILSGTFSWVVLKEYEKSEEERDYSVFESSSSDDLPPPTPMPSPHTSSSRESNSLNLVDDFERAYELESFNLNELQRYQRLFLSPHLINYPQDSLIQEFIEGLRPHYSFEMIIECLKLAPRYFVCNLQGRICEQNNSREADFIKYSLNDQLIFRQGQALRSELNLSASNGLSLGTSSLEEAIKLKFPESKSSLESIARHLKIQINLIDCSFQKGVEGDGIEVVLDKEGIMLSKKAYGSSTKFYTLIHMHSQYYWVI